jgi:hypothetical protein
MDILRVVMKHRARRPSAATILLFAQDLVEIAETMKSREGEEVEAPGAHGRA